MRRCYLKRIKLESTKLLNGDIAVKSLEKPQTKTGLVRLDETHCEIGVL